MTKRKLTAHEQFENELSSLFTRWWEESDLDEEEMAVLSIRVIERFCDTTVEFECDFDLELDEEE